MAESSDIEKLYEYGARLNEAADKSKNVEDYRGIIKAAGGSDKAKQLAAQLIPKYVKHFPDVYDIALDRQFSLCEEDEIAVRVQAIRGLPFFVRDTPENVSKIVDVVCQLLAAGEIVERDAVHKTIMSFLRHDVKTSLTSLFKYVKSTGQPGIEEGIREKVLCFLRDKVFPLKAELLKPQEETERHITDLVKKSLHDVTDTEFKMFMDFLKSLSIFGQKAPAEHIQELVGIIEEQADLDVQFNVSDGEHINRIITCLYMALPLFKRGGSSSKFMNHLNNNILNAFDKFPEERKLDLLKNLADCSHHVAPPECRQLLPSVVELLKKTMVRKKLEEMNFTFVECLLYTFHHLAHKVPNATNSLCGYKIVTGQPSDRLGEDFSKLFTDFNERLSTIEDLTRAMMKKLTQGMAEHNKAMAAAKTDEEKNVVKKLKQNATANLRCCNNILAMTHPLHSKAPAFIGDQKINLSWKEAPPKPSVPSTAPETASKKRAAAAAAAAAGNGSSTQTNKRGRGGGLGQNQLVSRALQGLNDGGRTGGGGGRSGRGWRGGRGRGSGYRY